MKKLHLRDINIGILGTGHLGMDVAKKLYSLGFNVFGFSIKLATVSLRSKKKEVPIYYDM